jgi:high-affinity nickel-transport protein
MVEAYGWAFTNPIRKLWYNLTITAVSVVVAFLIGGIEALGLLGCASGLRGDILNRLDG